MWRVVGDRVKSERPRLVAVVVIPRIVASRAGEGAGEKWEDSTDFQKVKLTGLSSLLNQGLENKSVDQIWQSA